MPRHENIGKKNNGTLNKILETRGMSPDEFFSKVSFSRSTFYRCLNEKISDQPSTAQINYITETVNVLSLTYEECKRFFGYVPSSLHDYESERSRILQEILMSPSPLLGENSNSEFEFYEKDKGEKASDHFSLNMLSVSDTARRIIKPLWKNKEKADSYYHYNLTIKLYNSCDLSISSLLARLIFSIQEKFYSNGKSLRIKVLHYMPDYKGISKDQLTNDLELLRQTLPLYAFCDEYIQVREPLTPSVWSEKNDLCIIKYSRLLVDNKHTIEDARNQPKSIRKQDYEYFLFKFEKNFVPHTLRAFGTCLDGSLYLYKFFTCDTRLISRNEETYTSISKVNQFYITNYLNNPFIAEGECFCFDSICYEHWLQLFRTHLNNPAIISYVSKIFLLEDVPSIESSTAASLEDLMDGIKFRYTEKCRNRHINIIWEEGLVKFVERRMIDYLIVDSTPTEILNEFQFSSETLRQILQDIKDSIQMQKNDPTSETQRYYILRSNTHGSFKINFEIMLNYGIFAIADKSFSKNISMSVLQNADIAKYMYDYWSNLINQRDSENYRYTKGPKIMTDEEAINLIDKLMKRI